MKIIKIVCLFALIIFSVILMGELYFRINLPYENGRYFNESTFTVYKEQAITVLLCLLIINILVIIFMIFQKNIIRKSNGGKNENR
jgi:hypothetical protein